MIKYIGSKRTLVGNLVQILREFPELTSVADVFSGTSRVGHAFKRAGYRVVANDHNAYAHCLADCYVGADLDAVRKDAERLVAEFNGLKGQAGYFTQTFCLDSRFFQPHNGERVDAIREEIERKGLPPRLRSVMLTSLMEAADRVDSTCGLQMAYVKKWATRAFKPMSLRLPDVLPAVQHGDCEALRMDANAAVRKMNVDVAYIDPPYNQHSYLGNYHIWESLVLWDKPEVYGVACKRIDVRERKSKYNSKPRHRETFQDLIEGVSSPFMIVSFNNEGYQSRQEMERLLGRHGTVFVITKDFKRYVGAQIGVYNPDGHKVGDVSHLRNKEYIYLVAQPELCERIPDALERLETLAARVGDPRSSQGLLPSEGPTAGDDRVSVVTRALAELGTVTLAELESATGLSGYQTRMALDSLLGRGLAQEDAGGTRRAKRYSLSTGVAALPTPDGNELDEREQKQPPPEEAEEEARHSAEWLENPATAIVAALDRDVGRGSSELQDLLGVGPVELRAALAGLLADGTVVKTGQRRGTLYLLSGGSLRGERVSQDGDAGVQRPDPSSLLPGSIVAVLDARLGRSSEELQRTLGVNAAELRAGLATLVAEGRVITTGQRRGTRYLLRANLDADAKLGVRQRPDRATVAGPTMTVGGNSQLRLFK